MNPICKETGCLYNENGRCIYEESSVKIPYARVCATKLEDEVQANFDD